MKKLFITITILSAILLSGCSGDSSKWTDNNIFVDDDVKVKYQAIIDENLNKLKEDSNNTEARFEVGYRYQLLGQYRDAVNEYEKVLEQAPKHFAALNNIAALYEKVEEYETAEKYIKQLYSITPSHVEVIRDTVRILLKADNPDDAQAALENFARLKGSDISEDMINQISVLFESIQSYKQSHEN